MKSSLDKRIIREVLPYLWPRNNVKLRMRVAGAMILLLLAKVATVSTPIIFKYVVDGLTGTQDVLDQPKILLITGPLGLVIGYTVMRLLGVGFAQLRDVLFAKVGQRALRLMARRTFAHLHALPLRFHLQRRTGALTRVIERGVKSIGFVLRFLLFSILPLAVELLLVAGIFLVELDITYFIVILLTMTSYVVFTLVITNYRLKQREHMNERDTESAQRAIDSLINFETVKTFTAEQREVSRYDSVMQGYEKASVKIQTSLAMLNAGQSLIITAGLCIILFMAANGVLDGTLTIGDFVMVNTFMLQITVPLNFLGTVYRETRQALVDMREMFHLLDTPVDITDAPDAKPLVITDARIRFEGVQFNYDSIRQILKGISFDVPSGKTVALVGHSGSGKSTISRLLMRLYDLDTGRILIDGQQTDKVTQDSLRAHIGIVPQDTVLFNDTIAYNIAYGRDNATHQEVIAAAKAADVHDFIQSLPAGYDTPVGERGLKLSGGEKQRVAIARMFLKNPPILILDEATSALDSQTEQRILKNLAALSHNRTVITIAHRLSTIVHAHEILVLDKGKIIERGTHQALLEQNATYARMWERQGEAKM